MYERLLVPVDGSVPSQAALREVCRIASTQNRLIRLIHVVDLPHWNDGFAAGTVGDTLLTTLRDAGQRHLNDAREVIARSGFDCDITLLESHGERAAAIIVSQAAAWSADLIIMGTHGRRGLVRLFLGSDAAEVARAAPVPLLLVRGP